MQIRFQVEVVISISNEGCSVDELCGAIGQVRDDLGVQLVERTIGSVQQALFLAADEGDSNPAVLEHHRKGHPSGCRCGSGPYISKGWRGAPRQVRTELGDIEFPVHQMMCKRCGKRFAPLLSFLSVRSRRHTTGLEKAVVESVVRDSFRPGLRTLAAHTGVEVPPTTAHHWWATGPWKDVPLGEDGPVQALMGDGTGFKGRRGKKGNLKVVIGFTQEGRAVGLATSAEQSWEALGRKVRRKVKDQDAAPELAITDGERDLASHLAELANRSQRCTWHGGRDLNYALWEDGMAKEPRHRRVDELRGLLGIEIPPGDWEDIPPERLDRLRQTLAAARARGRQLEEGLRNSHCPKAAGYVHRLLEQAFTHVEVWLELGITLPRTTSFLEGLMGRLGRRLKKIAWNWSDAGATRMARVLLKKTLEPEEWQAWVRKHLAYEGRCFAVITSIRTTQVTGFV